MKFILKEISCLPYDNVLFNQIKVNIETIIADILSRD